MYTYQFGNKNTMFFEASNCDSTEIMFYNIFRISFSVA